MVTLIVPSIHCSSCETHIQSILSNLPIHNLSIDRIRRSVSYTFDKGEDSSLTESLLHSVQSLLDDAGYAVDSAQSPSRGTITRMRDFILRKDAKRRQRHLRHCTACQAEEVPSSDEKGEGTSMLSVKVHDPATAPIRSTRLSIEGMTCSACTGTITHHISSQPGVSEIEVNLVLNSAVIIHDTSVISVETLTSEIEDLGYEATLIDSRPLHQPTLRKGRFGLEGMTCSSCSNAIESAVRELPAVSSVSVSLVGNSMEVIYDPAITSDQAIIDVVSDIGYEAELWGVVEETGATEAKIKNSRTIQVTFDGTCANDVEKINSHLASLPLLSFTPVTYSLRQTTVTYAPPKTTIRSILDVGSPLNASLYSPPSLVERSRQVQERETARLTKLFLFSFFVAIPTFVIGVVGMSLLPAHHPFRQWCEMPIWGGATRSVTALWIMASIVQFGVGSVFYRRAWKGVSGVHRSPWRLSRLIHFGNMDLLVALSTTVAYFASLGIMARDIHQGFVAMEGSSSTYFDSSVFLIFFILAGRVLEGRAKVKTGDAIALLGSMRPETALLVAQQEKEGGFDNGFRTSAIPVDHVEIGDYLLIQPGAVPPADGVVAFGSTTLDESSLTGEFLPATKVIGDAVKTGTTNLTAPIIIRVEDVGDETMLQKIVRAVAEGQTHKAPIERLADSITSVFVPIIVWLSLSVLAIWLALSLTHAIPDSYLPSGRTSNGDRVFFAFEFAISCLVIACPCGIGLAAPTAQAVGSGMAAKAGILAQGGGEAFQIAANVDTVVFDKTGTLTLGEPVVSDVRFSDDIEEWLWHAVRMMEAGSSHPLALAIAKHCAERNGEESGVRVVQSEEISGKGVKATVSLPDGRTRTVLIGNEALVLSEHHAELHQDLLTAQVRSWRQKGHSVVLVAISCASPEDTPLSFAVKAFFAISDSIRPEAESTITSLQSSGKEVYMLTGDNEITARAVASRLNINADHVVSGVLPHEKAEFITMLQDRRILRREWWRFRAVERKSAVAFCGDGLNDSAALASADVGIALAHGSQVTIAAASFVLLSKTSIPSSLITLLTISRKVYNRQKMNFGWALVYNVCLIPIAAGVLYPHKHTRLPPVWSALAMALSSVSVVVSSLALRWGL